MKVSSTSRPLWSRGKVPLYPVKRKLNKAQSRREHFVKEKFLSLLGIEPPFL
jgi:hypothetical protein